MNSLIIEVNEDKYLVRYQVLKSVVSRKHTTKEGKVITRNELHPNSIIVYFYSILESTYIHKANYCKSDIKLFIQEDYIEYIGRGLSKCSDKDRFDKKLGISYAISNIGLNDTLHNQLVYALKELTL